MQAYDHLASPRRQLHGAGLYNLLRSSTLPLLEQAAATAGNIPRKRCARPTSLPGRKYLAEQVDKKQRHEIRRKMRRAAEYEQPVRWYIVEDEASLDAEIEAFLRLMAYDEEKNRFLTGAMRQQMRQAMHAAFRGGWLQLAFMEVNGEKAAGYLNFDYNQHIWVYNSGLDFRFREISPGWVLVGHLLQWANDNQRQYFDFMRGDEEYKYRFGAIDRRVVRAKIIRSF
jgi:CelD/BcsL family acetyltransferase involved in cellulose biosynthesis